MNIVNNGLSEKLMKYILNWTEEYDNNIEHDMHECIAWNELVSYLMELEKDVV